MTTTKTLWRAADSDTWSDCASFALRRADAEAYRANPGYGGATLYRAVAEIDPSRVLDLIDCDEDAIDRLCEAVGCEHPGAIGADEHAPRISYQIREAGYDWVRVRDSYPEDCETWIYVGGIDAEPTLEAV